MLNPNFLSFLLQDKLAHLRNLLDKLFHIFYNQYNLLHVVQTQFDQLYNHPKVPSLKRHKDKHEHIDYIRYNYHKLIHCVT